MVLVADAGCLERSLIPRLQVLEVQEKRHSVLNLMDEAAKKGIELMLPRSSGSLAYR